MQSCSRLTSGVWCVCCHKARRRQNR